MVTAEASVAQQQQQGRPKVELVGYANFKRHNPKSDHFAVKKFHHVEFWCMDATNTFKRWVGLVS
jgi:4-hydroxyphenylpyruvate dioxygenase